MENKEVEKLSLSDLILSELSILKQIEDSSGEISPETDLALSHVQLDRADKIDQCKYMIDQFTLRAESLKAREQELAKTRKQFEATAERIKKKIKEAMLVLGIDEAMGHDYRFRLVTRKDPKIVVFEDDLPQDYKMAITQWVPDRERIAQDLQLGLVIPGANFEKVVSLTPYVNSVAKPKKKKGELDKDTVIEA